MELRYWIYDVHFRGPVAITEEQARQRRANGVTVYHATGREAMEWAKIIREATKEKDDAGRVGQ